MLAPFARIATGRRTAVQIRGIVRTATLQESPPGSDRIEMHLRVQGVGPQQPRLVVVPYELLLEDSSLDVDQVEGKAFQADVVQDAAGTWIVAEIAFASGRVLRKPDET
jgi:hypothetical protein